MGHIFISYSRKDIDTTDHIVSLLKKLGFEVWIDREGIKGGELWRVEIVEAIDNADAFVLMLSPNSAASDNVRKEVDLAEGSKLKLFPVLLAAVTLPAQLRYQLAGIQWIDYTRDPEEKFQELVRILQAHQQSLVKSSKVETTREAELVIGGTNLARFGVQEQEKLLDYISEITATPRGNLSLINLSAGSVHAFISMPAHSAYVLKTAALNRDGRLLKQGIDAVRLNGEKNYILVKTGKISTRKAKPRSAFPKRFVFGLIALGVVVTALLTALPAVVDIFTPTFTPTSTATSTPIPTSTPTRTPTHTEAAGPTPTPTPTNTFTPTPTPTIPLARRPRLLFDFVEGAPFAFWNSCAEKSCDTSAGETSLTFNDPKSAEDGFAVLNGSYLEDGSLYKIFLFTQPRSVPDGRVRGFYDLSRIVIQKGDRFKAKVGFIEEATDTTGVTYRLYFSSTDPDPANFKPDTQYVPTLIDAYAARYDGKVNEWIVILPESIFGQSGWFILEVNAGKSPEYDWAVWVEALLERP